MAASVKFKPGVAKILHDLGARHVDKVTVHLSSDFWRMVVSRVFSFLFVSPIQIRSSYALVARKVADGSEPVVNESYNEDGSLTQAWLLTDFPLSLSILSAGRDYGNDAYVRLAGHQDGANVLKNERGLNVALLTPGAAGTELEGTVQIKKEVFDFYSSYSANDELARWAREHITADKVGSLLIGCVAYDVQNCRNEDGVRAMKLLGANRFSSVQYTHAYVFMSKIVGENSGETLYETLRDSNRATPIKIEYVASYQAPHEESKEEAEEKAQTRALAARSPTVNATNKTCLFESHNWLTCSADVQASRSLLVTMEVCAQSDAVIALSGLRESDVSSGLLIHLSRAQISAASSSALVKDGTGNLSSPIGSVKSQAPPKFSNFSPLPMYLTLTASGFLQVGQGREIGSGVIISAYLPPLLPASKFGPKFVGLSSHHSTVRYYNVHMSTLDAHELPVGFTRRVPRPLAADESSTSFTTTLRTGHYNKWLDAWSLPTAASSSSSSTRTHVSALITFSAQATSSVMVALAEEVAQRPALSYEVLLGDNFDGESSITTGIGKNLVTVAHSGPSATVEPVLHLGEDGQTFWVLLRTAGRVLVVGRGVEPSAESVIMKVQLDLQGFPVFPRYFSFTSVLSDARFSDIQVGSADGVSEFDYASQSEGDEKEGAACGADDGKPPAKVFLQAHKHAMTHMTNLYDNSCEVCRSSIHAAIGYRCVACKWDLCMDCYEEKSLAPAACTFAKTGAEFTIQPFFYCDTCGFNEAAGRGVCEVCAVTCHDGHTLRKGDLENEQGFYCDCGSGDDCKDKCMGVNGVKIAAARAAAKAEKAKSEAVTFPADSNVSADECSTLVLGNTDGNYTFFPTCWRVDTPNDMIVTVDVVSFSENVQFLFFDSRNPRESRPQQAVEICSVCLGLMKIVIEEDL